MKGTLDETFAEMAEEVGNDDAKAMLAVFNEAVVFLSEKDTAHREWVAPQLTDIGIDVLVSLLFLQQAEKWDYKKNIAEIFIREAGPRVRMNLDLIKTAKPTVEA
jgi:hypothetical protein